jgi:hypothetical protein
VDAPSHVEVLLNMTDTGGGPFTVRIKNVIYVPDLTHKLFSISQFTQNNNTAATVKNFIYLTFIDSTVTCHIFSATIIAFNTTIA